MLYPNSIKKDYKKVISHKNRGMDLENSLNRSNEYYLDTDEAVIYKKPTPIGVVDVKFYNDKKIIEKAYFKTPSTLDYNGLYKGKYIEFEAKETINKNYFKLSNIHKHQLEHLERVIKHGGIAFLIIKINNIIYLLKGEDLLDFIKKNTRKSIPFNYLQTKGYEIPLRINPELDYLKIVKEIYKEKL